MFLLRDAIIAACGALLVLSCESHPQAEPQDARQQVHTCTVEWVDFVRFDGIGYSSLASFPVDQLGQVIGPEFARVAFRVPSDCDYRPKDGDAAYLEPGTPLYAVTGYRTNFVLAANTGGVVKLYEADDIPNAKTGADLLDIDGKVAFARILANDAVTEVGRIKDPAQVEQLVAGVLQAKITRADPGRRTGEMYFVSLHMHDGIVIRAVYWQQAGELSRGIRYPLGPTARDLLNAAIRP